MKNITQHEINLILADLASLLNLISKNTFSYVILLIDWVKLQ